LIPVDRGFEAAASWALLVLVAVIVGGAVASTPSRRARQRRAGAALMASAALFLVAGWSGTAGQLATWAQVPYLLGAVLPALMLSLVGVTLVIASFVAAPAPGERRAAHATGRRGLT